MLLRLESGPRDRGHPQANRSPVETRRSGLEGGLGGMARVLVMYGTTEDQTSKI
jgi:hypothetical protein